VPLSVISSARPRRGGENRKENTMSLASLSDMTKLDAIGFLVAAVGIVIQIIGGIDYPVVSPGLVILVVAAGLVTFARWSWVPFVGVLVPTVPARRRRHGHRQRG
jgi:hypothetical protein